MGEPPDQRQTGGEELGAERLGNLPSPIKKLPAPLPSLQPEPLLTESSTPTIPSHFCVHRVPCQHLKGKKKKKGGLTLPSGLGHSLHRLHSVTIPDSRREEKVQRLNEAGCFKEERL